MTSRESILQAVRANHPLPAVPLPEIPEFAGDGEPLVPRFRRMLEVMGGRSFEVADATAAGAMVKELFPDAKIVCSAVPEVPGTRRVEDVKDPHELNDVDVGVVRTPLAVAEMGAVWLTQEELVVSALGVLSEHLLILLDPAAIVETIHDAYRLIDLARSPYGVFLAGPSATGDIEGVIIRGAQGARSLTVLLLATQAASSHRAAAP
jgi:L-lactate dehydrogenase complex protein LldG